MVGHTGKYEAAVKAATATDEAIGLVLDACNKHNYVLLVTADHGNCERMIVSVSIRVSLFLSVSFSNVFPLECLPLEFLPLKCLSLSERRSVPSSSKVRSKNFCLTSNFLSLNRTKKVAQ